MTLPDASSASPSRVRPRGAGLAPPVSRLAGASSCPSAGYPAGVSADLEEAWIAVHDATPAGWYVGRPSYSDERREWVQYAFDPSERPSVALRSREWTLVIASLSTAQAGSHR